MSNLRRMNEYEFMQPAVDEICNSMVNDPHRWEISTLTIRDRKSKIQYWLENGNITHHYEDGEKSRVFSNDQGDQIQEAYRNMKVYLNSLVQQKVLKKMGLLPIEQKAQRAERAPNFFQRLLLK